MSEDPKYAKLRRKIAQERLAKQCSVCGGTGEAWWQGILMPCPVCKPKKKEES